ncbi:MAG: TetR family transcriptional regulator [Panacagrimonas sp.]
MAQLIVPKDFALTSQSAATRARLIKTAEQLFSERGIERVSLQCINLAAGQKNKNATHYHFGDKRGLLIAILDKHQPAIILRRDQLLDELDARGDDSVAGVVRAMLYPMAEKLFDADGGREYIRIAAELSSSYAAVLNGLQVDLLDLGSVERLASARRRLTQQLPEPVAQQRIRFVVSLILNGLADQSRALDAGEKGPAADTELLIRNLEDGLIALCNAPVSKASTEALLKTLASRGATRTRRSLRSPE